jgi:hypothetical protein
MLAGIGSMQADVPPQMIEIDAVGAIAILHEKRCITPMSAASGHGPRSWASSSEASSALAAMWRNILRFHALAMADLEAMPFFCRNEWKPITPMPTERSRAAEYLARAISSGARSMKSLQHCRGSAARLRQSACRPATRPRFPG